MSEGILLLFRKGGGVTSVGSVVGSTGLGVVRVGTVLCQWVVRVGTTMQVGSVKALALL